MTKPKLNINPDNYPGDRNIHDLILAKSFSSYTIRKFLKERGIFPHTRDTAALSKLVARHIFSYNDITELVGYANLSDHRPKTSVVQLTIESMTIDTLANFFQNEFKFRDDDVVTRIQSQQTNPEVNETKRTLNFTQKFTKIDFKKTALLQESEHEFTLGITKKDTDTFEVVYSTTASESIKYFQEIQYALAQKGGESTYFHDIDQNEIKLGNLNKFFDDILSLNCEGYSVRSVESVRLKLIDRSDPEVSQDQDNEDEEESSPKIKELNIHGKSVIEHDDVTKYRDQGYYVVSVAATLEKCERNEERLIKFRAGFSKAGKFETEIVSEDLITTDENGKNRSTGVSLTKGRREHFSKLIHEKAFEVFENYRSE